MSKGNEDFWSQVYDELRNLAKAKLKQEKPGQTLQATALANEVYLRLRVDGTEVSWSSQPAFYKVAAEMIRRVLVDQSRRKNAIKRGEGITKLHVEPHELAELAVDLSHFDAEQVLQVDEGLEKLAEVEPMAAKIVELRFFGGLKQAEIAETLEISLRSCDRLWAFARAWMFRFLNSAEQASRI